MSRGSGQKVGKNTNTRPTKRVKLLDEQQETPVTVKSAQATLHATPSHVAKAAVELQKLYVAFKEHKHKQCLRFYRINAGVDVGMQQLVGRLVHVYWPSMDSYYTGTVASYDPASGQHQVEYYDGEVETLHLPLEKIRVLMHASERLVPPAPSDIEALGDKLVEQAQRQLQEIEEEGRGPQAAEEAQNKLERGEQLQELAKQRRQHATQKRHALQTNMAAAVASTRTDDDPGSPHPSALSPASPRHSVLSNGTGTRGTAPNRLQGGQQAAEHAAATTLADGVDRHTAADICAATGTGKPARRSKNSAVESLSATVVSGMGLRVIESVSTMSGPGASDAAEDRGVQQIAVQVPTHTHSQGPTQEGPAGTSAGPSLCLPPQACGQHGVGASGRDGGEGHAESGGPKPGDVVWAHVKGWAPWPALVVTQLEAADAGKRTPANQPESVAVQFFGSHDHSVVGSHKWQLLPLGIQEGHCHHSPGPRGELFWRGLYELRMYMQDGQLFGAMQPGSKETEDDSDEEDDSSSDETEAAKEPPVSEKGKKKAATPKSTTSAVPHRSLPDDLKPVKVSDKLQVLTAGEIEYHHPSYHDKKWIYPVDYVAERLMSSPASNNKEAPHICHIVYTAEGPIFRIYPKDTPKKAIEASSAAAAVAALLQQSSRQVDGRAIFGLTHAAVRSMIQQLPNAAFCDRFQDWIGPPPEKPEQDAALHRARMSAASQMQVLPRDVEAVDVPRERFEGVCHVCGEDNEYDGNHLLQCDRCLYMTHMDCYDVSTRPNGRLWLCDVCRLGINPPPACALCPVRGGMMKRTVCGRWAHGCCALWTPETCVAAVDEGNTGTAGLSRTVIEGLDRVPRARKQLCCSVCKQQYGAAIQCAGSRSCVTAFHPLCARGAGYVVEWVEDKDEEDRQTDRDDRKGPQGRPLCSSPLHSPWGTKMVGMSPGKKPSGPLSHAVSRGRSDRRTAGTATQDGGIRTADGILMLCFCPRHRKPLPSAETAGPSDSIAQQPRSLDGDMQAVGGALSCGCSRAASRQLLKQTYRKARGVLSEKLPAKREIASKVASHLKHHVATVLPKVLSVSDRFRLMRATQTTRTQWGKSSIHGHGLFARTLHQPGDMVIEYAGDVVRHSVADLREKKLYNSVVGAGTYVFNLSEELCIDATRKGSLAHLINHSCLPNCYSRTITVLHQPEGRTEDHVVICAKTTIKPGEEFRYDYRFCSREVLPCNCGAPTCRGTVNCPDQSIFLEDCQYAPVHQLRLEPPPTPAAAQLASPRPQRAAMLPGNAQMGAPKHAGQHARKHATENCDVDAQQGTGRDGLGAVDGGDVANSQHGLRRSKRDRPGRASEQQGSQVAGDARGGAERLGRAAAVQEGQEHPAKRRHHSNSSGKQAAVAAKDRWQGPGCISDRGNPTHNSPGKQAHMNGKLPTKATETVRSKSGDAATKLTPSKLVGVKNYGLSSLPRPGGALPKQDSDALQGMAGSPSANKRELLALSPRFDKVAKDYSSAGQQSPDASRRSNRLQDRRSRRGPGDT